jgi:hypothetical protein
MTRIVRSALLLAFAASLAAAMAAPGDASAQRGRQRRQERIDDRRDRVAEAMTGWTRLGERWVQHGVDHDTIAVGAREGTFRQIAIRVEHSALQMFDITVTFGDGTTFSPQTRLVFAPDTTTRTIDLPGAARIIRRVDFRYGNLPGGGRAQVELWAR